MGFRFPGSVHDEAGMWSMLNSGTSAITQIPEDRWPVQELQHPDRSEPGRSVTFAAGVLSDITGFDAGFFGISPREAAWLDPQQRLLLKMAHEAMEQANLPAHILAGSDCGVYVGISSLDYGQHALDDLASMTSHVMTGNTLSIAANRISYLFDLHGPSLSLDTACSSSMVALHHACQALREGSIPIALAGGISLLLHPYSFVGFSKASMISARGQCLPFDARADGYVRAEGGGLFLLKPLDAALRDHNPIQAVIVASGINTDGARKKGLTIPSAEAQAELMTSVLEESGLDVDDLAFIEAHGTGTPVGDPVEVASIGTVLGSRRHAPLPISSVKAHVGHLEPASGMAGLVKAIVCLKHRMLPGLPFAYEPNPAIDFGKANVFCAAQGIRLEAHEGHPLAAGVNSFGFGGANAHILLAEAPALQTPHEGVFPIQAPIPDQSGQAGQVCQASPENPVPCALASHGTPSADRTHSSPAQISASQTAPTRSVPVRSAQTLPSSVPLFLSARDEAALRELAGRYADTLEQIVQGNTALEAAASEQSAQAVLQDKEQKAPSLPKPLYDLAYGSAHFRDWHEKCLALVLEGQPEPAIAALRAFARGEGTSVSSKDSDTQASVLLVSEDRPHKTSHGTALTDGPVFVYTGNGAQWSGMGQALYATSPVFARTIDELNDLLLPRLGRSLTELLLSADAQILQETAYSQPLLFAIQVGVTRVLAEMGVRPAAVLGHSVGEIAAAWAAGALTLEDAAQVIFTRSTTQATTRGCGRMAACAASASQCQELIEHLHLQDAVEIAGINSPKNVTLSGSLDGLRTLQAHLPNTYFQLLDLDYAFHSRHMDALEGPLLEGLAHIAPRATSTARFVSTVTGAECSGEELNAAYWWANVRQPVRFHKALDHLAREGFSLFVEIGPHAILQRYIRECLQAAQCRGRVLASLLKTDGSLQRLTTLALRLHCLSPAMDRDVFFPCPGNPYVSLPTYPWQETAFLYPRTSECLPELRRVHPLLGWQKESMPPVFENILDPVKDTWLEDHKVGSVTVFAGAAFAEMACAAARYLHGTDHVLVEDLQITAPLAFEGAQCVRCLTDEQTASFRIVSRPRLGTGAFVPHVQGRIPAASGTPVSLWPAASATKTSDLSRAAAGAAAPASARALSSGPAEAADQSAQSGLSDLSDPGQMQPGLIQTGQVQMSGEELYQITASLGLDYGTSFRLIKNLSLNVEEGTLEAELIPTALNADGVLVPPQALDACFHSLAALYAPKATSSAASPAEAEDTAAYLPVGFDRLEVFAPCPHPADGRPSDKSSAEKTRSSFSPDHRDASSITRLQARLLSRSRRSLRAHFQLLNKEGQVLVQVTSCRFRAAPALIQREEMPSFWTIQAHRTPLQALPDREQAGAGFLPSVQSLVRSVHSTLWNRTDPERSLWYEQTLPLLEALSLSLVLQAFQHLTTPEKGPAQEATAELLSSPAGRYWASVLQEEGLLNLQNGCLQCTGALPAPEELMQEALRTNPQALPFLVQTGRAGLALQDVLAGSQDGSRLLHTLQQRSPVTAMLTDTDNVATGALAAALDHLVTRCARCLPEGRVLRLWEVCCASGPASSASEAPLSEKSEKTEPTDSSASVAQALATSRLLSICRTLCASHLLDPEQLDLALIVILPSGTDAQSLSEQHNEKDGLNIDVHLVPDWDLNNWAQSAKTQDQSLAADADLVLVQNCLHKAPAPAVLVRALTDRLLPGGLFLVEERAPDWHAELLEGLDPSFWRERLPQIQGEASCPTVSSDAGDKEQFLPEADRTEAAQSETQQPEARQTDDLRAESLQAESQAYPPDSGPAAAVSAAVLPCVLPALRPARVWEQFLGTMGLEDATTLREPAAGNLEEGAYLLLAHNPNTTETTCLQSHANRRSAGEEQTDSAPAADSLAACLKDSLADSPAFLLVDCQTLCPESAEPEKKSAEKPEEQSGDQSGNSCLLTELASDLAALGHRAVCHVLTGSDTAALQALKEACSRAAHVVLLLPSLPLLSSDRTAHLLHTIHQCAALCVTDTGKPPHLWIVTRNGTLLPSLPVPASSQGPMGGTALTDRTEVAASPAACTIAGLARVLGNELAYPTQLPVHLVDLAPSAAGEQPAAHGARSLVQRLAQELDQGFQNAVRDTGVPGTHCSACALSADRITWADEVLLTPSGRYTLRLVPCAAESTDQDMVLEFSKPGRLDNLVWRPRCHPRIRPQLHLQSRPHSCPVADTSSAGVRSALPSRSVLVQVMATGLNFRDVMLTMGLLPDDAVESGFARADLGLEFSGRVLCTGSEVTDLAPGDRVVGFGRACFASSVLTEARCLARIPEHLSYESAASLPVVFFTAWYSLKHLANLRKGERLLIHGAAGGLGMAALQIARYLGAEVYATAGSDEKRDYLRLMGVRHVYNSRDCSFVNGILADTEGEGVDVVLNSLASEAMRQSLALLRPFGRFLELGKRDFVENTSLGLKPFKENISYFAIDADELLAAKPDLARELFAEVMNLFDLGVLSALPCRIFDHESVVEAFRTMQKAWHMGKIVVRSAARSRELALVHSQLPEHLPGQLFEQGKAGEPGPAPQAGSHAPDQTSDQTANQTSGQALEQVSDQGSAASWAQTHRLDRAPLSGTWLVSGGLGGFGRACVQHLADRGVRSIVVTSRKGLDAPGARELVTAYARRSVTLTVCACDMADSKAVQALIAHITATLPPLQGIIHAAAVFDDKALASMDEDSFARVLAPKYQGALNLHAATSTPPLPSLQHFVLFSSISTMLGNPGQANYVAANAGLEGLTRLRLEMGLPCTCLAWGPVGDVGYLTRHEDVKKSLGRRLGAAPLSVAMALKAFDKALGTQGYLLIAHVDWEVVLEGFPVRPARLSALARHSTRSVQAGSTDFHERIRTLSSTEVAALVLDLAREEVAHVLNMEVTQVPLDRSLQSLGLDSLMAVELAAGLEQRTGVNLPVMLFSDAPTLEIVAQRITSRLIGAGADNAEDTATETSEGVAALASEPKAEAAKVSTTQTSPSAVSSRRNTGSSPADSAKVHADQHLLEELARRHAEDLDASTLQDIMHDASQNTWQPIGQKAMQNACEASSSTGSEAATHLVSAESSSLHPTSKRPAQDNKNPLGRKE